MSNAHWGVQKPASDGTVNFFSTGNLNVWYQHREDEFWIGHLYSDEAGTSYGEDPPEELEWSRWAVKKTDRELHITPVFPDLPVIVFSEFPLRIIPDTTIQIYTRIPIWVRFESGESKHLLTEMPSIKLSKTWFGTPVEGELCYWAATKARRSLSQVEEKDHVVNCPIQIANLSPEDLHFEKFCFRVERLRIFEYESQKWSDETGINYHGEELNSDITMSGRPPAGMKKSRLLSGPRKQVQRSLATRTFRKILDEYPLFGR